MAESEDIPNGPDHEDEPISKEEMAELDRPLHELLGIELNFAPESLAPPVDERQLLAFIRHELSGDERELVIDMVTSFRSWYEALGDVLRRTPGRPHSD